MIVSNVGLKWVKATRKQDLFVKHNAFDNGQFKDGHDHRDKYLDTSRKILLQEILMCNMKALMFIKI